MLTGRELAQAVLETVTYCNALAMPTPDALRGGQRSTRAQLVDAVSDGGRAIEVVLEQRFGGVDDAELEIDRDACREVIGWRLTDRPAVDVLRELAGRGREGRAA